MRLHEEKSEEYAEDHDALVNFNGIAAEMGVQPETVLRIFALKHWRSVADYVRDLESGRERKATEPVKDRIDDLIVYLLILRAMVWLREYPA